MSKKSYYLTTKEFLARSGISIRTLRRRIKDGLISAVIKKNNCILISFTELPDPKARESFLKDQGLTHPQEKKEPTNKEFFDLKDWEKKELKRREDIVKEAIGCIENLPWGRKTVFKNDFTRRHGISVPTLERWINDYLEGGRNALIPDWTCGNRESLFTPEIARFIESSYLQPFGPTIKETHEKIMGTFPGCHISYRLLAYYIINRWNKSYQLLIRNKEEWDRKYSPHARRDWNRVEINECWFSDAKQIDVAYIHNEKVIFPWLTAFIDARSRKFVGWVLTATHDSRAIAQAFVYAVRAHGVPKVIYIDRGKPYKSRAIAGNKLKSKAINLFEDIEGTDIPGILRESGCEIFFAYPNNPREKAIIEAAFKIFTYRMRHLPGYRGHNVKTRPKKLEQEIKSGKLLSLEELSQEVDKIINDRNSRPHSTTGEIPNSFYEGQTFPIPSERYLAYLLMDVHKVRVRDSAVLVEGMLYRGERLFQIAGEPVEVRRDPQDLSKAAVIYQKKLFEIAHLEIANHYRDGETLATRAGNARLRKKIKNHYEAARKCQEALENPVDADIKLRPREIRPPSPKVKSLHPKEKLAREVVSGLKNQSVEHREIKVAATGGSIRDRYIDVLKQKEVEDKHLSILERLIESE